jgi:hypothetical protein
MSGMRAKALAIYREGRLHLLHVTCRRTAHDVDEVIARVRSSREGGPAYAVDLLDGVWSCTCGDGSGCAHVAAVQLATGHPSGAAA